MNKPKDGAVLKSDVLWIIQNHIRNIQMNGAENKSIKELYSVMEQIGDMEVQEAHWLKCDDGAWKCSHCGFKFWNCTKHWMDYCEDCGYKMV